MNINYFIIFLLFALLVYIFRREGDYLLQKSYIHGLEQLVKKKEQTGQREPDIVFVKPEIDLETRSGSGIDIIGKRDEAVINDNLYPPLDRMNRPLADEYLKYKINGDFGFSTRDNSDTYRLIGYLINSADRADKWNLFGRQKNRGSNQGEYYAIQQCNSHGPCVKININDDIVTVNKFRDYYNLPTTVTFNSPVFAVNPYDVIQLKTSVDSGPYF